MEEGISEHDRLFIEAMNLLIALDRRLDAPEAIARVDAWHARGPQYRSVWREVLEIDGLTGAVLSAAPSERGIGRRLFVLGLLSAGAGGAIALQNGVRWFRSDYATARAEVSSIDLPDGSVLTLGPRSNAAFASGKRQVELLAGMAIVSVGVKAEQPFSLRVGEADLMVRRATFDVSDDGGELSLSVLSGEVSVSLQKPDREWTVTEGHHLGVGANGSGTRLTQLPVDQMGLWREGQILADDETVGAMVTRVSRWQTGRVLLIDRALSEQRVSGIFNLHDPTAALRAIVGPYGGRVRQLSPLLTIVSSS